MVMDTKIQESSKHLIAEQSKKLQLLLQQTHNEALLRNEIQITRWVEYRKDHEELSSRLLTLRDSLSHEIMVPLGKKALMKGRLVHTNEILVCLGDGWFAKKSANQAADICQRRIKHCDKMLKQLYKEKDLISSRNSFPHEAEAFGEGQTQEIIEPYNEEEERKWRERHRQKEREYRQKLTEIQQSQRTKIETKEDLWKRLDELDEQEEIEDKIIRLDCGEDTEDVSSNEDSSGSEQESDQGLSASPKPVKKGEAITRRVSFKEEPSENVRKSNQENGLSDENSCRIVFRHSDHPPAPVLSEAGQEITSPAVIYRHYLQNRLPKSILKPSASLEPPFPSTMVDPIPSTAEPASVVVKPRLENSAKEAIVRDVMESTQVPIDATNRPVSRFKAARLASKR